MIGVGDPEAVTGPAVGLSNRALRIAEDWMEEAIIRKLFDAANELLARTLYVVVTVDVVDVIVFTIRVHQRYV
jgi:nitrogen regulatory protein PII-like uncharacterized protein